MLELLGWRLRGKQCHRPCRRQNLDTAVLSQPKQVLVSTDDVFGLARERALEDLSSVGSSGITVRDSLGSTRMANCRKPEMTPAIATASSRNRLVRWG